MLTPRPLTLDVEHQVRPHDPAHPVVGGARHELAVVALLRPESEPALPLPRLPDLNVVLVQCQFGEGNAPLRRAVDRVEAAGDHSAILRGFVG